MAVDREIYFYYNTLSYLLSNLKATERGITTSAPSDPNNETPWVDSRGWLAWKDVDGNTHVGAKQKYYDVASSQWIREGAVFADIEADEIYSDTGINDQYLAAAIPFSESGTTGLDGSFTATSIIAAINELKTGFGHWSRDITNGYVYTTVLTDKIGIGTSTPSYQITVSNNQDAGTKGYVINTNDHASALCGWYAESNTGNTMAIIACPPSYSGVQYQDMGVLYSTGNSGMVIDQVGNFPINIYTNAVKRLTIDNDGVIFVYNKIAFTQTDENEYVDSLADGYLDLGATNAVRMNTNLQILEDGGDPMCIVGDTMGASDYGFLMWDSSESEINLGTQGNGNYLSLKVDGDIRLDTGMSTGLNGISAGNADIADDNFTSFTPVRTHGFLAIGCQNTGSSALIAFGDLAGTKNIKITAQDATAIFEVTTVQLDGTTGLDGKFTVGWNADGKIYLENRLGGT